MANGVRIFFVIYMIVNCVSLEFYSVDRTKRDYPVLFVGRWGVITNISDILEAERLTDDELNNH